MPSIFSCIGSVQGAEKECDESRGENISEMRLVDHCPPMIPPDSLALEVFKVCAKKGYGYVSLVRRLMDYCPRPDYLAFGAFKVPRMVVAT